MGLVRDNRYRKIRRACHHLELRKESHQCDSEQRTRLFRLLPPYHHCATSCITARNLDLVHGNDSKTYNHLPSPNSPSFCNLSLVTLSLAEIPMDMSMPGPGFNFFRSNRRKISALDGPMLKSITTASSTYAGF